MATISDVLREKGNAVWQVRPDDTVYDALALMALHDVGAVLVVDGAGNLVGVLSERDYARKVVLKGQTSRDTRVSAIMSDRPICVAPDASVHDALTLMTTARVRHLPVVNDGRVVGVVSIGDVVKQIISAQGFVIGQLERYIRGA